MPDRIVEDNTDGDLRCPECGQEFARLRMIGGKAAHKIIQGKVYKRVERPCHQGRAPVPTGRAVFPHPASP